LPTHSHLTPTSYRSVKDAKDVKVDEGKKSRGKPVGKKEEDKNEKAIANDSESEEQIITKPNNGKRATRVKKIHNELYMNSEKEKYMSRFANAADMISSSESEPEKNSDEDDDFKSPDKEESEESSEASQVESLIHSSQASEYAADENSHLEESYFEKSTGGKKRLRPSNVSSNLTNSKAHMVKIDD
jgi:hypothetical protein